MNTYFMAENLSILSSSLFFTFPALNSTAMNKKTEILKLIDRNYENCENVFFHRLSLSLNSIAMNKKLKYSNSYPIINDLRGTGRTPHLEIPGT